MMVQNHARYRRRIAWLFLALFGWPAEAALKPKCTADERLCPLEYGSTRFICVDRDSVANCGGCSSNGSGQNCENLDAAAVGCSKNGDCMACFWNIGGWEPEGFDDELICEVAERQVFSPPPQRIDPVKPVRAPEFVHQLSGEINPSSPFFFGNLPRSNRDPVGRMAAAAPWAAARNRKQKTGQEDEFYEAPSQPRYQAKIDDQSPLRPAPIAAAPIKEPQSPRMAPIAAPKREKALFSDDEEEDLEDSLTEGVKPLAKAVKDALPQRDAMRRGRNPRLNDPMLTRALPQWLKDRLEQEERTFTTEEELLDWLQEVSDSRPKSRAEARRRRTNAERFALDLPPLPPPLKNRKPKPGDEERQKARERRMELEELRAMAELQAFREGKDPDEAIAAVRLPPLVDEKKEEELTAKLEAALKADDLDVLPSDLLRAMRALIASESKHQHGKAAAPRVQAPGKAAQKPIIFQADDEEDNVFADEIERPRFKAKSGKARPARDGSSEELDDESQPMARVVQRVRGEIDDADDDYAAPRLQLDRPVAQQDRFADERGAKGRIAHQNARFEPLVEEEDDTRPRNAPQPARFAPLADEKHLAKAPVKAGSDSHAHAVAPGGKGPKKQIHHLHNSEDNDDLGEPLIDALGKSPPRALGKGHVREQPKVAGDEQEEGEPLTAGVPEMGTQFVKAMQNALGSEGWKHFLAALQDEGHLDPLAKMAATPDVPDTPVEKGAPVPQKPLAAQGKKGGRNTEEDAYEANLELQRAKKPKALRAGPAPDRPDEDDAKPVARAAPKNAPAGRVHAAEPTEEKDEPAARAAPKIAEKARGRAAANVDGEEVIPAVPRLATTNDDEDIEAPAVKAVPRRDARVKAGVVPSEEYGELDAKAPQAAALADPPMLQKQKKAAAPLIFADDGDEEK